MYIIKRILFLIVLIAGSGICMAQGLEGTWKYIGTSLSEESAANIRKELNSDTKLEQRLTQCLTKVGYRAGSTLKFDNEGNFVQRVQGKNYEGTYSVSSDNKLMTMRFNNGEEEISLELNYQPTQILLTVPGDKFMEYVNVNETKTTGETLLYILCLVTQFEGTKLVMKYVH